VDKLDAAINQGLKSPDSNSSLGRLGAAAKKQRRNQGAIVTSSGMKLD
jgi:hypothetical protein